MLFRCISRFSLQFVRCSHQASTSSLDIPSPSASSDDVISDHVSAVFDRLLVRLESEGKRLVIAPHQRNAVCKPVQILLDAKVEENTLIDYFAARPDLYHSVVSQPVSFASKLNLFRGEKFRLSGILLLLTQRPDLLKMDEESIHEKLALLRQTGIRVAKVVPEEPSILLDPSPAQIQNVVGGMSSFFSARQTVRLLESCPQLLTEEFENIADKYEFLYFDLGLQAEQLLDDVCWLKKPINFIRMRGDFAKKTGIFVPPDQKKPMVAYHNPHFGKLIATSDWEFSKICSISLEEYQVFKMLWSRREEPTVTPEEDESGDEEIPYTVHERRPKFRQYMTKAEKAYRNKDK